MKHQVHGRSSVSESSLLPCHCRKAYGLFGALKIPFQPSKMLPGSGIYYREYLVFVLHLNSMGLYTGQIKNWKQEI